MSFNEQMGLGSHSEDAAAGTWCPCQDDAASTVVADQWSGGNDGTLVGGNDTADISESGPNGWLQKALHLDGSADYVDFGDPFSLDDGPFTIFMRASLDAQTSGMILAGIDTGFGFGPFARIQAIGGIPFTVRGYAGANPVVGDSEITAGTWWSFVLTASAASSSTTRLYVEGAAEGTPATGEDPPALSDFWFAAQKSFGAPQAFFDGLVADGGVLLREWSAAEAAEWDAGPEPVNTIAPALSGTPVEGETLSVTTGSWGLPSPFASGSNGTVTYAYQWTRSNDAGGAGESDIGGATASSYTLQAADVGKFIRCRVRASNNGGFDAAADTNSDMSGAIASAGLAQRRPAQQQELDPRVLELPPRRRPLIAPTASSVQKGGASERPRTVDVVTSAATAGLRIVKATRPTPDSLAVRFVSVHAGWFHQLYAGRKLIGETINARDRHISGPQPASTWPEHIELVAVHPDLHGTDVGDRLPARPYNRVRARFRATGFPDDTDVLEVYVGTAPRAAVGSSPTGRMRYVGDVAYSYLTPALAGTGYWLLRVNSRDDKPAGGNAGTALDGCQKVLAYPPDFTAANRFETDVAGGILTLTAVVP